jgi:hypothetical protein
MVIAGFAVGRRGTPLDLDVASVLSRRFGREGLNGENGSVEGVMDWLGEPVTPLGLALVRVAALYHPNEANLARFSFVSTVAGLDGKGVPVVKQLAFWPRPQRVGPLNRLMVSFQVLHREFNAEHFVYVPAGIECVADAIFDGSYRTTDQTILKFYQTRKRQELLDTMTLAEMRDLAKAMLQSTALFTWKVGGDDQIGIIPPTGEPEFIQKVLVSERELLPRVVNHVGCAYSREVISDGSNCSGTSFAEDFSQPLDVSYANFYMASRFQDTPVILDHNYFVEDQFQSSNPLQPFVFRYYGPAPSTTRSPQSPGQNIEGCREFYFDSVNTLPEKCIIEAPPNVRLPGSCLERSEERDGQAVSVRSPLSSCTIVHKSMSITDEDQAVGGHLRWRLTPIGKTPPGCISVQQMPGGGVTVTAGGKDCPAGSGASIHLAPH